MKLLTAYVFSALLVLLAIMLWPLGVQKEEKRGPAPTEAAPGIVWRSGVITTILLDDECPYEDIKVVLEFEGVPPVRAYRTVQADRIDVPGCWARAIDGDVLTMSHGSGLQVGLIPLSWFTKPGAN